MDHHIHIFSPDPSGVLDAICRALGPKGCPLQVSHAPSAAADVIQALDAAGIEQGVLLSSAYFFDSPDLAVPDPDAAVKVRAKNAFIIAWAHLDLRAYFANERASLAVIPPEWMKLTKNVAPYVTAAPKIN